jgi:DNA-binding NtrC family response regulator
MVYKLEKKQKPRFSTKGPIFIDHTRIIKGFEAIDFEQATILDEMVSTSPKMKLLFEQIKKVAMSNASVLIRGETGTGKELVARALHRASHRANGPFRAINCATLTPDLLASELFGHVKGAFTGAISDRQGLFYLANHGTLFLDEIAELPLELQARLLRVIEEREFIPVGGTQAISVDVRLLCATHRSLRAEVEAKRFREDLMYRIRVIPLYLPPLRERGQDLLLLAHHFLTLFQRVNDRSIEQISPAALQALLNHPWEGNIRELKNVVEYMIVMGNGTSIELADLPPEFQGIDPYFTHQAIITDTSTASSLNPMSTVLSEGFLAQQEKQRIISALSQENGHRHRVAQALGISRATLWRKMKEHGIS